MTAVSICTATWSAPASRCCLTRARIRSGSRRSPASSQGGHCRRPSKRANRKPETPILVRTAIRAVLFGEAEACQVVGVVRALEIPPEMGVGRDVTAAVQDEAGGDVVIRAHPVADGPEGVTPGWGSGRRTSA